MMTTTLGGRVRGGPDQQQLPSSSSSASMMLMHWDDHDEEFGCERATPSSFKDLKPLNTTKRSRKQRQESTGSNCGKNPSVSFPAKLLTMLNESPTKGWTSIVSWQMNDTAFRVHKPDAFVRHVMPQYFNQTKYKSFQRQLNLYGFSRITRGPNKGCYVHEQFQRSDIEKCLEITRKKVDDDDNYDDYETLNLHLGAPTWFNHADMAEVEPDPIAENANRSSSSGVGRNHKTMMNAFESYFQTNVIGTSPVNGGDDDFKKGKSSSSSSNQSGGKKPAENALQRMLEGYLGPEQTPDTSLSNTEDNMAAQQEASASGEHSGTGSASRKKYQRAAVFPDKLHDMLEYVETSGLESIASWQMDGRAFKVHNISRFMKDVMPLFFKQSKYESLQRQLNLYGFTRVPKGPMKGCYHHPLFIKGGRNLSSGMARRKQEESYNANSNDTSSSPSFHTIPDVSSKSTQAMTKQKKKQNRGTKTSKTTNVICPEKIPSLLQEQQPQQRVSTSSGTLPATISGNGDCCAGWVGPTPMPCPSESRNPPATRIMDLSSNGNHDLGNNAAAMLFNIPATVTGMTSSSGSIFERDYTSRMNDNTNNHNGFVPQPWGQLARPISSMNTGGNIGRGISNSSQDGTIATAAACKLQQPQNALTRNSNGFAAQPWANLSCSNGGGMSNKRSSDCSNDNQMMFASMPWAVQNQQSRNNTGVTMNQASALSNHNSNNSNPLSMFGFVPTVMTDFQSMS